MEPPESISEELPSYEESTQSILSPVKSLNIQGETPAQTIISKAEDLTHYMESLVMENHLPSCNVPEKIVIALDIARDENYTYFLGNGDEKIPPFNALVSAIEMFAKLKQRQSKNHEFGIVLLKQSKAFWDFGFSSDLKQLSCSLKKVLECKAVEKFDLTSLFTIIVSKIKTYEFYKDHSIPPPYVVRLVLFYNRSYTIPELHLMQNIKELLNCPYFFVDVLAAHEPVSDKNQCEEIFKRLQNIDTKGYSYFFNVGRNTSALIRSVLKLVGHPLQRPLQSLADYSL
ncbi:BRISC and BRCA1-A complex member 1-like [Coccinella septempunctata]|uniref:BRISC and BRCA1-A complex member 1-like n=1 Tax=Coccinella septempunctata TaxID=41139 RepID=UPI001D0983CE|nr:BRISC and BRCA1-A complex member 1-like [Coccinella septempunctata]